MTVLAAAVASAPATAAPVRAQVLPTVYEAGHFYAVPETRNGQQLKLLVDTGGGGSNGMYWISKAAAQRLQLKSATCTLGDQSMPVVQLPDYKAGRGLPSPGKGQCGAALLVFPRGDASDGQLGAGYLPGRVWTFDYPAHRLTFEGDTWQPGPAARRTPLGFQRDAEGRLGSGFARITIRVDGQPLDMLLDTGASSYPTPAAARISGTPTVQGEGVTSYITTSVLERWHKAHPDWRVVEHADDKVAARPLKRIIEVPKVEIAGWSVGPVWFTEQPDRAYHQFMAQWMDKPTEGAVGGNVFQHFVMTLDYPHETAWFRRVNGCKPAATPPPAP
ncbi:hypothetical protein [Dyella agri]|uniref:Peptidase A2 domain-containing protein n=1 Tax=Dyella agri TaxID=1926869 RepID=A0ABW8KF44_9GAMM